MAESSSTNLVNGVRDPEHPTNTHINDASVGRIKDGLKQLLISEEVEEVCVPFYS